MAENHIVALFEVQALLGSPLSSGGVVPHPRRAWTILNVTVNLQSIVDLTAPASQTTLATTAQELTGDWRGYQLRGVHSSITGPSGSAPTQDLGSALFNTAGVEGFRSLSAKLSDQMVLVVFPQKLRPGSFIQFLDPTTGQTHSILPHALMKALMNSPVRTAGIFERYLWISFTQNFSAEFIFDDSPSVDINLPLS